jgi:AbrB family looped-hinge helix DNA binding protein
VDNRKISRLTLSYNTVNLDFIIDSNIEVQHMETTLSRVTSKGQVVIPKRLREKYGIRSATSVRWIEKEQGILIVPESENPISAARGMLKGSGVMKAYLKEKSREKKRENKRIGRSK